MPPMPGTGGGGMKRLLVAILACLVMAPAASAGAPDGVVQHVTPPAKLDAGKAYLLFDSSRAKSGIMKISHVLMRVPRQDELDAYLTAKRAAYEKDLPKLTKAAKDGPAPTIEEYGFTWKGAQNIFAVDMDDTLGAIPEISANKYMLWVRFTTQGGDLKPKSLEEDVPFELTLCNF